MIQVQGLGFAYKLNRQVLDNITFAVENGKCVAILGNNGAGKSTLLKCLNHILRPQGGSILVNHKEISRLSPDEIAREIAFVTQQAEPSRVNVFDAVLLGRKPYIRFHPSEGDYQITRQILADMQLQPLELAYLDELSGGEIQKVMLARALAQQPQLLLLDEPTSNLDLRNQYQMMRLVQDIARQKQIGVILVIHDLNLALRYSDYFLLLKDKKVFAYGDRAIMTADNLEKVYHIPIHMQLVQGMPVVVPIL